MGEKVAAFIKMLNLDTSRNEILLFHGCPRKGARDPTTLNILYDKFSPNEAILKRGFDERLGSHSGMMGSGLYFADKCSKADQYAGKYHATQDTAGEEASMFLSRVGLGAIYLANTSLNQMRRPPCICGHFDANLEWIPPAELEASSFGAKPWSAKGLSFAWCDDPRFDSVMSDKIVDERPRAYHEYAVFGRHCYPEFHVTYRREGPPPPSATTSVATPSKPLGAGKRFA